VCENICDLPVYDVWITTLCSTANESSRRTLSGVQEGSLVLLERASARGAQIEDRFRLGMATLHCAADKASLTCLLTLLEKGYQPETSNKELMAALHSAFSKGHLECIRVLLLAEAYLIIDGAHCSVWIIPEDKMELFRRRLKVELLSLRYSVSGKTVPKSKNTAGDLIVSNEHVRPWFVG